MILQYKKNHIAAIGVALALTTSSAIANSAATDTLNEKQQAFVEQTAKKHKLTKSDILAALEQASLNDTVIEKIQRPWEAKPWHQYYPIFIKQSRIERGAEFWLKYQDVLAKAEKQFNVPAEIIVAILGVESFYGERKGTYPVLDTLYSLSFHYPSAKRDRSKFFQSELGHYLKLVHDGNLPLTETQGSYAGAMGWGQFIASSYQAYAVDFDGDNVRDIVNNPVDAIGSVANYFAKHKWKMGEPVAVPVAEGITPKAELISKSLKPKKTLAELVQQGIRVKADLSLTQKAKIYQFEQPDHQEYWVGLHNFYVITRYNHSPLYAMAVFQLSEKIKQQKTKLTASNAVVASGQQHAD